MSKRRVSILVGAICAAAMVALYCTSVEFDNPLDENGTNFLNGDTTRREDKIADCKGENCVGGGAGLFDDPALQCDRITPVITRVGDNNVSLAWAPGHQAGNIQFRQLMGRNGWEGVVTTRSAPEGQTAPNTPLQVKAELYGAGGTTLLTTWTGHPDIPQTPGVQYIIRYTVTKLSNCIDGTDDPTATVDRIINIVQYVAADTARPTIALRGSATVTVNLGNAYDDPGASASPADAAVTTTTSPTLNVNQVGDYIRTYTACRQLTYTDGRPPEQACASVTRTIQVREDIIIPSNIPIIVLKGFTHTNINGATYTLNNTTFTMGRNVNSFTEPGTASTTFNPTDAIERIFYVEGGQVVDITNEARSTVTRVSTGSSSTRWQFTYTLPGTSQYNSATAQRQVFAVEQCEDDLTAPDVVPNIPATHTIPANTRWDHDATWVVSDRDESYRAGKLGIHFGTLNPDRPQPGTYVIQYVGVGGCGRYTVVPRTINVQAAP